MFIYLKCKTDFEIDILLYYILTYHLYMSDTNFYYHIYILLNFLIISSSCYFLFIIIYVYIYRLYFFQIFKISKYVYILKY